MQKINKPFVTFPHIHRQHDEEKEEKTKNQKKKKKTKKKHAKIRTWAVSFSTQKLLLWYMYVTIGTQLLLT